MLKIFDKNHNAMGHVVKYKDCKIESELSTGDKTLSFTFLAKHHNLENEMYIQTKDDEFVIKEVPATTGSSPQIVAILNLEDLQKDMWEKFSVTDATIDEATRVLLAGTGWRIGDCDVTKRRNAGMIQVSSLEAIQKLCTAFMCEPVFDTINKKVSFYVKRGEDKGTYFISGLNLKKIQKKSTSYDYYTRIIPIGANGLTIESVNDGKNYLENYQYSNKVLTYIWKDESYTDAQALKEDAELKLDDLSKPEKAYSVEVYNLAKQNQDYSILSYGLGDTVVLIDRETNTREKQRIVKIVEYPQDHSKDMCEIANTILTFEEMQQKVQAAAEIINCTIAGDGRYTGTINVSDILHFEQGIAGSTTVSGINSSIYTMQGDLGAIKIKVGEVETNYLKADEAELKYATIENLDVTNQTVHSIQGDYADFKTVTAEELSAQRGIIDELSGSFLDFKTGEFENLKAKQANFESATADNFTATNGQITNLSGELSTYKTQVAGQFTAFDADITNLKAKNAELAEAVIGKASITDLEAVRTRTQSLEADVADINTLVNGNLTSANIHSLTLNSKNTTIENGMIKNAMIESLAFDKITGIDVNTTKLTVHSEDGKSTWTDNTIQISDANRVRVQIGEDASGDYTLAVWDKYGKLIWDALGATENTIQRKIIKDAVVADDAAIAGSKLNIPSVVKEINGCQTRISSSVINIDQAGQTLSAYLNVMETTIGDNLDAAKSYADAGIAGIEIGARNLVEDSREITTTRNDTTNSWLKEKSPFFKNTDYGFAQIQAGGKFTLSFDYEITGITTACKIYPALKYTSSGYNSIGKTISLAAGDNTGHFEYTFTPTAAQMQYGTQWILSGFGAGKNQGAVITLRRVMLEKGTKGTDWKPAPEDTDAQIGNLTEITTTHSTNISVMQGRIEALITEDSNIKGDYNALVSRYNGTVATVEGIQTTIGEHTTLLDSQSGEILATKNRITTVETGLDGIKTRVSAAETALKKKADGTTVDTLTSRVATCESTLDGFEASLTDTNKTVSDNFTALNDKFESIEIGGRNLIKRSAYSYKSNGGLTISYSDDGYLTAKGTTTGTGNVTVAKLIDVTGLSGKYTFSCERVTGNDMAYNLSLYQDGAFKKTVQIKTGVNFITFDATGCDFGYISIVNTASGRTIETKVRFMLEKGTKATDWTPAPEDIRADLEKTNTTVSTHAEQISSHEARITATEKSIELKVSSSEFSSYQTTVTNAIDTAKSNAISTAASDATTKANNAKSAAISAAATDATTKASNALADAKSFATNAIAGIEIGGRNLILNSESWEVTRSDAADNWVPGSIKNSAYGISLLAGGGKFTMSFDYVVTGITTACNMIISLRNNGSDVHTNIGKKIPLVAGDNTGHYEYTFTPTEGQMEYGTKFIISGFGAGQNHGAVIRLGHIKFEKGTKATSWSPAPEDLYSEIDLTNATVATHTETLSTHDTRITAAEKEISLKVATVDFNSYKTTVTGDINTAKSAAISAAANDATTKANKALSDAKTDATTKANNALASAKSYTNGQITTVNESLSKTNQEISVMQGQIAMKVEQTDIDTAITKLELGGRNLLLNTLAPVSTPSANRIMIKGQTSVSGLPANCTTEITEHGYKITVNADGKSYPYCRFGASAADSGSLNGLEPGQTYTISCEVKYKLASNATSTTTCRIYLFDDSASNGTFAVKDSVYIYATPGVEYDTWTPLALTFTVDENATMLYINIRPGNSTASNYAVGDYIAFRNIKLEKGTKATDWTQAPEDVDASIETVDSKFASYSTTTQMNAAITAAKDSITSTVSQTYATKSEVSTVSGKVTSLESWKAEASQKITKDGIVATVGSYYATQTYADNAKASAISTAASDATTKANNALANAKAYTDDMEIGGTNLLPNTRDMAGYTKSSNITLSEDKEGITVASFAAVSELNWNRIDTRAPIPFSAVRGKKVTLSLWVRSDDATALNADASHGLQVTLALCTGTSAARTLYRGRTFYATALSKDWQKITYTATLTDSSFSSGTGTIDDNTRFYVQVYNYSVYRMQVKKLKLEFGDKATDWQPSPDDDLNYIASVESIATQTKTMFGWIVKSGSSSTDFTLTDRTATLVANAINLQGLVTFSGLDSTAQGKITTAQSTADTAKNNAAAAQSTADTAKSNAATAQSTANTANARATYNYGTCSTAAATAAKTVTAASFPALYTGATVWVKFTNANTAASPTLNVNGTGAKAIYAYGAALTASSAYNWVAGATVQFIYNGTQWELADSAGLNKANTAQSTANIAKTNAATAQTTADAAKSTADAADTAIAAWCYNNNRTYINGGKIYTKSIKAAQIDVTDLFAQNITATGTITGVTLKSAVINSNSGNIGGLTIANGTLSSVVTSGNKETHLTINSKTPSIELYTDDGENLPFSTTIDKDGITCWNGTFSTLEVNGEFTFSNYAGNIRRAVSSASTAGQRIANTSSGVSSGTYFVKISGEYGTSGTFVAKQFNATTSDIRLKENVVPATVKALPVLNRIGMYQFDWKQDHTHWDVGFVADYLEEIDSKFAIGGGYDEDGNMDEKGVNEFYLMGYVVKGVQELCVWNTRTDASITDLDSRVTRIDARVDSMDAKYQSKTATLESQVTFLQCQLQQAFERIAEQDKLIKQLQAVG